MLRTTGLSGTCLIAIELKAKNDWTWLVLGIKPKCYWHICYLYLLVRTCWDAGERFQSPIL